MKAKLTYAYLKDEFVSILDPRVKNGIECNCICAECEKPLIAKNNERNIREKHFAHQSDFDCKGAVETAIHTLAKIILLKNKELFIPDFHYDYINRNPMSKYKEGRKIIFESIIIEETIIENGIVIKPDAIGVINKKEVYIEFAKSHFVDDEKLNKIKKLNKNCIEVNINHLELNEDVISKFLTSKNHFIYWLNNPRFDNMYHIENERMKSQGPMKLLEINLEMLKQNQEYDKKIPRYIYDDSEKRFKRT